MTGQVVQFLHEIPELAAEAWLTIDHPNPGHTTAEHRHTKTASIPAPTNLHALVALWRPSDTDIDRGDPTGSLMLELLMAVRVIVEEHPDTAPDWPDHTWTAICAWLRDTVPLWEPDRFTREWVDDTVRRVWRQLRALCRVPREVRYVCSVPGCGWRAHMQPGNRWLLCEAGHQLDIEARRWEHLASQEWTLTETRDQLRTWLGRSVPMSTLKSWVRRGKLRPMRDDTRPLRYNFGAVVKLVNGERSA